MSTQIPADLQYVDTHEWIHVDGDIATIGITDHAQQLLGDVVYVELTQGAEAGVVESVKAASDIYAPLSGTAVAINDALVAAPETANSEPYGAAWFFKIKLSNPAEVAGLLDAAGYAAVVGAQRPLRMSAYGRPRAGRSWLS